MRKKNNFLGLVMNAEKAENNGDENPLLWFIIH